MMCQGNLLGLDPDCIYLYSNTLQSIAAGYLITAVLFLYTSRRTQIGVAVALLLVYWAAMQFITVGSYGGGNYTPEGNLAEWIDRTMLGRFRDGAKVVDGEVVFCALVSLYMDFEYPELWRDGIDRFVCRLYCQG